MGSDPWAGAPLLIIGLSSLIGGCLLLVRTEQVPAYLHGAGREVVIAVSSGIVVRAEQRTTQLVPTIDHRRVRPLESSEHTVPTAAEFTIERNTRGSNSTPANLPLESTVTLIRSLSDRPTNVAPASSARTSASALLSS